MKIADIKPLKYYIIYCIVVIGFFTYSGLTGWNWFNSADTEATRPTSRSGHIYRYHK